VRLPVIWTVTTGQPAMRHQTNGLAEAIGGTVVEKRIAPRWPWSWLPATMSPVPLLGLSPAGDRLSPPWPDILISCGRRTTPVSVAVRRASRGHTMTVHVQDPLCRPDAFDLVIAMGHDRVRGDNVFVVDTALHAVTDAKLAAARVAWADRFQPLPPPRLGVLLGGRSRHQRFTPGLAEKLVRDLTRVHADTGAGVMVTPSRRTETEARAVIAAGLAGQSWAYFWDGNGDNPYVGILAWADSLLVTDDSLSMISEALATAKPVATYPLAGRGRTQQHFLSVLRAKGYAPEFAMRLPTQSVAKLASSTLQVAEKVRALWQGRISAGHGGG
jgi:uncharacterized protein